MSWTTGDRLTHRFNPELGSGRVVEIEGRTVVVSFPKTDTILRLALDSDALEHLNLVPGSLVLHLPSETQATISRATTCGRFLLSDGREVEEADLWPVQAETDLVDRLASGNVDSLEAFHLRIDCLRLKNRREADGLGSFLGGRIRLFPHQLFVAEKATREDPVRMLLADEVGLGKTVESCLILNHLLVTGRANRTVVITPETLSVQWLGELWRKYHQVFVLIDDQRIADVEKDYGPGFNPFDAYPRIVIARERLEKNRKLVDQAVASQPDLVIVDEAHHLKRAPGHPGNPAYRAIAPLAALARHLLLLTAVPLEDDVHGFFRLLELLRPNEIQSFESFQKQLDSLRGLPPCTSATRRSDIGGLPPRLGIPVHLDSEDWSAQAELLAAIRELPIDENTSRRRKIRWLRRASTSAAALSAILPPHTDPIVKTLTHRALTKDPRVDWLVDRALAWRTRGEKTLVFVSNRETLEIIRQALDRRSISVGVFHEDLSFKQRDIGVAQFRLADGPAVLISTECGGEGRNFEFCHRLVLFDLPWNPVVVEQRIGRLDRIGRDRQVEIVYFNSPDPLSKTVASLYERLGIFERPLGSLERELSGVEAAIEELASQLPSATHSDHDVFESILTEVRQADRRIEKAAFRELHRDPYRPELAETILARLPSDLEELTRTVVLAACGELGLEAEEHRDRRCSIEFDSRARVESLPGVGGDASYLGTFDRETAVADETIDFFSTGHALVEGLLAHLEENSLGRVALLRIPGKAGERGFGLLAIFSEGSTWEAVAIDLEGHERADWCARLLDRPLEKRRVRPKTWTDNPAWPSLVTRLAKHLVGRPRPVAIAAFQVG